MEMVSLWCSLNFMSALARDLYFYSYVRHCHFQLINAWMQVHILPALGLVGAWLRHWVDSREGHWARRLVLSLSRHDILSCDKFIVWYNCWTQSYCYFFLNLQPPPQPFCGFWNPLSPSFPTVCFFDPSPTTSLRDLFSPYFFHFLLPVLLGILPSFIWGLLLLSVPFFSSFSYPFTFSSLNLLSLFLSSCTLVYMY